MSDRRAPRIWLVDDEKCFRETLCTGLQLEGGWELEDFDSCEKALSLIAREGRKPDILLLDIRLRRMTGIKAIGEFLAVAPDCRIIMLTMSGAQEDVASSMKAGAFSFVQKTAGLTETANAIRRALTGQRHVDDATLTTLLEGLSRHPRGRNGVSLSERERAVLNELADGRSRREIAQLLEISEETVITYLKSIYQKLDVHKASVAVKRAIETGLI